MPATGPKGAASALSTRLREGESQAWLELRESQKVAVPVEGGRSKYVQPRDTQGRHALIRTQCDEAKPTCGRCQKSRIQCDRYARYPVFINRGRDGFKKRAPLEEVIPYTSTILATFGPEAESDRLIAWFCDSFTASNPSQHDLQPQQHWLALVAAQTSVHPALKSVLLAISLIRWSKIEDNLSIKRNGRRCYQASLALTQQALSCAQDAASDDILATTCIMTLYELLDSNSLESWLSHMLGLEKLLCFRGPQTFTQATSRAIFEHARYVLMIKHLNARTLCVFGDATWLELPWRGVCKTLEQQVFDQGLLLTTLLERCDSTSPWGYALDDLYNLLKACSGIHGTLARLDSQIKVEMNAMDPASNGSALSLLCITALGIQLEAANTLDKLLRSLNLSHQESLSIDTNVPIARPEIQSVCDTRLPLAQRIIKSVKIRSKSKTGALGRLRMIWSLQIAMQQFRGTDSEHRQCCLLLTSLSQAKSPFDALRSPCRSIGN